VTSAADELDLSPLRELTIRRKSTPASTAFENQYLPSGRVQILRRRASELGLEDVPAGWRSADIVHLAPIANEIPIDLAREFSGSFVGLTVQGALRTWDSHGRVTHRNWKSIRELLELADAVVLSLEDLQLEPTVGAEMAAECRTLVVTEGARGATLYEGGRGRSVPPQRAEELDPTGAGDIFAAVFFIRLHETGDAWAAAQLSNRIAARSVERVGLAGAPTAAEARDLLEAARAR
jgi:sugar/nucleoside kinase (ribokinase family)